MRVCVYYVTVLHVATVIIRVIRISRTDRDFVPEVGRTVRSITKLMVVWYSAYRTIPQANSADG